MKSSAQPKMAPNPLLAVTKDQIEEVENWMLENVEPVECPLTHIFAPGVYYREIFMPNGVFIIGHEHKTTHLNIVLQGEAAVMMNGNLHRIAAPFTFVSEAGVRKILYIVDDMRWATIHLTVETDLKKLEEELIVHSPVWDLYHEELNRLKQAVEKHELAR